MIFKYFFEHRSKGIFMFSVNFGEFWYFLNIIFSFAPEKSGHFNIMKKTKILIFWFWEATARKKLWFSCIFDEKVTKKQHTRSANSLFLFFPHFFYNGPAVGFLWKHSKKEEENFFFTTFAKIIIFLTFLVGSSLYFYKKRENRSSFIVRASWKR